MNTDMMNGKSRGEIVLYQAEDGKTKLDVRLEKETIWLDAHQMGVLFERDRSVIVKHILNIYKAGELSQDSTCAKNAQVAADGWGTSYIPPVKSAIENC